MNSKNDPILDAQAFCQVKPHSETELRVAMSKFGWALPVINDIIANNGYSYLARDAEGNLVARNGTVKEASIAVISPAFKAATEKKL